MKYNGPIYRPPTEAQSFLLPTTEGCSHNACTFCNMFQGIPFRILPLRETEEFLSEAVAIISTLRRTVERVCLTGGDPFALPTDKLLARIDLAKKYLPAAKAFTMYARTDNISRKSDSDLRKLAKAGVDSLYIGVDTALDDTLNYLNKGYKSGETLEQCQRLNEAGIHHCDLFMLGAAGRGRGLENARAVAELENAAKPRRILLTTMTAYEGTKLNDDIVNGVFTPASSIENLREEKELISRLDLPGCQLWAAHSLDGLPLVGPLVGYLGPDTKEMLDDLNYAIHCIDETAMNRTSSAARCIKLRASLRKLPDFIA